MSLLSLLASENYITVNKDLIREMGLEEAVIFGELCSEYCYWEREGKLTDDEMFFCSIENLEYNTGLSEYKQRKAINSLKEAGYIDIEIKGLPATRYFKINEDQVLKIFKVSSEKIKELDSKKLNLNKNINNKNKTNKKDTNTNVLVDSSETEFLGSAKTKKSSSNLYTKCVNLINDFTDDEELNSLLVQYLNLRLEMRDKPMYTNQFKGLLNKLKKLSTDVEMQKQIVSQSLEKGYASFYEVKDYRANSSDKKFSQSGMEFTEYTDEDKDKDNEFLERLERDGKRTKF